MVLVQQELQALWMPVNRGLYKQISVANHSTSGQPHSDQLRGNYDTVALLCSYQHRLRQTICVWYALWWGCWCKCMKLIPGNLSSNSSQTAHFIPKSPKLLCTVHNFHSPYVSWTEYVPQFLLCVLNPNKCQVFRAQGIPPQVIANYTHNNIAPYTTPMSIT